jgi:hypothetical protein
MRNQRTQSTYLFGAVCPTVEPAQRWCCRPATAKPCNCISMRSRPKWPRGAHAILLLDRAGWHLTKALKVPSNIALMPLPARSPELNPQENIWQFMRANWLSNRVFKSYDDIVDHCCYAWNTFIDQPCKIMSIAHRDWAAVGHPI